MAPAPRLMTVDDYLRTPETVLPSELVYGVLRVAESPLAGHQSLVAELFVALRAHVREHRLGTVWIAPLDVILGYGHIVSDRVHGAPDLAIEVLSPGTRKTDETRKRRLYERFGVDEYWIVDPEGELIKVYRRSGAGYGLATELTCEHQHVLETPLFPGLRLALADVFAQPQ